MKLALACIFGLAISMLIGISQGVSNSHSEALKWTAPVSKKNRAPKPHKAQSSAILLAGTAKEAYAACKSLRKTDAELADLANELLREKPSKNAAVINFLRLLTTKSPKLATAHARLGQALLVAGQRPQAIQELRKALALDKACAPASTTLEILSSELKSGPDSWIMPVSLDQAFAPPSQDEIRSVLRDWSARQLASTDGQVVDRFDIPLGTGTAEVRIIAHNIYGFMHYGAVIVPAGAKRGQCPVILEARGVSWNYDALQIPEGLSSPQFMGEDANRFVYVVPGFRGEYVIANGREYLSEGDAHDSWDGATDDAIALLNVAIDKVPEIDPDRIASFGRSRGGTVAMLLSVRDLRFKRALNWAGPAGWIENMSQRGITQRESMTYALGHKSKPFELGGQATRTFLIRTVLGREGMTLLRRRLIASSPVYFASRFVKTLALYGADDWMVPPAEGMALKKAADKAGTSSLIDVEVQADAGHALNPRISKAKSKAFLMEMLRS